MATGCMGRNRDGSPCSAWVPPGRAYCQWHDPDREAERHAWRAKGGANKSNRQRARRGLAGDVLTMSELAGALCRALRKVETGELEPNVANSMATLAKAVVAVQQAGDLEERLTALEAQAAVNERRGRA